MLAAKCPSGDQPAPLLVWSGLFQALPAGGVAWRPRPGALRAQRDQGLRLRPRQRIHRREQDQGRCSGDGPADPAGGRPLTCERRQLKGVGVCVGVGGEDGGQQLAVFRWRSAIKIRRKEQNKTWVISASACFCPIVLLHLWRCERAAGSQRTSSLSTSGPSSSTSTCWLTFSPFTSCSCRNLFCGSLLVRKSCLY